MAVTGFTGWWGVVLDAPDARGLADFYARLLGWPVARADETWAALAVPDCSSYLAFQTSPSYVAPNWPGRPGQQRMMGHIDIGVSDLEVAVADAEAAGARLAEHQPQDDVRVMIDPAGHPFCLYLDRD